MSVWLAQFCRAEGGCHAPCEPNQPGLTEIRCGLNDICWVSDQVGLVVYSPVELPQAQGKVFTTHDGGLHWDPVPL